MAAVTARRPIRLCIAEDDLLVREGARTVLDSVEGIEVLGMQAIDPVGIDRG